MVFAGDPRYAPDSTGSLTVWEKAGVRLSAEKSAPSPSSLPKGEGFETNPRYFPTPVQTVGYSSVSDVTPANSASKAVGTAALISTDAGSGHSTISACAYVTDAAGGDVINVPPLPVSADDAVTHSVDQREAGPANRWSVYGVDPRYAPVNSPQSAVTLPPEAYTGYPGDGYTQPAYVPQYMRGPGANDVIVNDAGISDPSVHDSTQRIEIQPDCVQQPLSIDACGPWKPPGISGPWPEDEYLFDGGDSDGGVKVRPDGQLEGLDSEDTVAHYQTLDGRTVVKPSCRVCIYSPRFAAVRQVTLAYGDNQLVKAGGVDMPIGPVPELEVQPVTTALQPVHPVGEIGERAPITFLDHTPPIGLISHTVIRATVDRLKPYENFDLIRSGLLVEGEMPYLAESVQAAIVWTNVQGVQVIIGGKKAEVLDGDKRAQASFGYEPPKHPCLRVCKVASTHSAKPGETVEFTLRFDNVGDQPVGNVSIVDNLTTRLELIDGSGQCSKDAKFFSEPNKEGSLILHWDINEPLKPGEGGIARFKCVVR
jgi:uncharacterized repeat protein (TIGR01451 family)